VDVSTTSTAATPAVGPQKVPLRVPALLAAGVVLVQITYPLLDGEALRLSTIATVVLFAVSSAAHAAWTLGLRAAVMLVVVAGGLGLLAEAVGVRTGYPFGEYVYTGSLGLQLLGVPAVVPLAWAMMAYPCLLLGRRLAPAAGMLRRAATALLGGLALASWDLYLDPQMVEAGHWAFRFPEPALPGVPGIPLTNYAGWVLVSVVIVAALDVVLPRRHDRAADRAEVVPAALLAWTWLGSGLANAVFFGRPVVAAWGVAGMGLLVGPYLLRLRRTLREGTS
jgi:carotene biosynthesis associated membrane protein